MSLQTTETILHGELKVSNNRSTVLYIANLTTSMAVAIYDPVLKVGGMAHIVLPESRLAALEGEEKPPATFADEAVPLLVEAYLEAGGQKQNAQVRMAGGSQLFNFGGGGGNYLNVGSRNSTAIRASLSKLGFTLEKADTGGNKARRVRLVIASGQFSVAQLGGTTLSL
ncbi:MAG: chemotaxis protein CheD [Vampirovibrio sp.]|nr:chemotaxis protein CheD [Vampirovibrio sp.]